MSVDGSGLLCVTEEGSLELGGGVVRLCFHQALNVLIVTSRTGQIRVLDPHSGLKLQDVSLLQPGDIDGSSLQCFYHGESNSVIVCGGRTVGLRRDHHGVLLLDTVLQTPVAAPEETVVVEMLLSEGIQLQQTLGSSELSNLDHGNEVRELLELGIKQHQATSRSNPKLAKWTTIRLELPVGVLRSVCTGLVSELKRLTRYIPALSTASALAHRLSHLLPPPTPDTGQHGPPGSAQPDRDAMFSEASRLATFNKWPHMNYKWALPEQMAQAGFFHQPIATDDDRAMCFICSVCLVYWEPTDEPWSEHERHSPNCPFVKGEYTHNVPLSVTYATSPALSHSERAEEVAHVSNTNSHQFMATATRHGSIVVWNTAKQLKKEVSFSIDPSDSTILDKHFSDTIGYTDVPLQPPAAPREAWVAWSEDQQTCLSSSVSETNPLFDNTVTISSELNGSVIPPEVTSTQSIPQLSPPLSPPPPPPPSEPQQVDLPLDDIAVDELFAPPRPSHDVRVSSLCVLADPVEVGQRLKNSGFSPSSARSVLVVGVGLRRYELFGTSSGNGQDSSDVGLVQVLNNVNQASQREAQTLDIMKLEDSRRESSTTEDDLDGAAIESESAESLCDQTIVSTSSLTTTQQNFVPYLLVYDLNVMMPQSSSSNKITTKSSKQGGPKKSTVKVGTFGQPNIMTYPKTKHLWSDPLANEIEMFFAPPNMFVKNKNGNTQVGGTGTTSSKSKTKENQVTADIESKNDVKKEPKCIQCIPLPHKLNSVKLHLTVEKILPSNCGEYIIVTLSRGRNIHSLGSHNCNNSSIINNISGNSNGNVVVNDMEDSNEGGGGSGVVAESSGPREVYGAVFVYRVVRGIGDVVTLQEDPVSTKLINNYDRVPTELLLLPPEYGELGNDRINDVAVCLCNDGSLRLFSLSAMEFIYHIPSPADRPFTNIVYCNS
ncbi:unnamed protein product, partial [Meganyctiphanes norvegica]